PGRAAGNDASAQLGVPQHLCDVELDAHDRGAVEHLLRLQTRAPFTAGTGHPRTLPGLAGNAPLAAPAHEGLAFLDESISSSGSGIQARGAHPVRVRFDPQSRSATGHEMAL